jgi:hypothetical protein
MWRFASISGAADDAEEVGGAVRRGRQHGSGEEQPRRLAKTLSARWAGEREAHEVPSCEALVTPEEAVSVAISLDGVLAPMEGTQPVEKRNAAAGEGRVIDLGDVSCLSYVGREGWPPVPVAIAMWTMRLVSRAVPGRLTMRRAACSGREDNDREDDDRDRTIHRRGMGMRRRRQRCGRARPERGAG